MDSMPVADFAAALNSLTPADVTEISDEMNARRLAAELRVPRLGTSCDVIRHPEQLPARWATESAPAIPFDIGVNYTETVGDEPLHFRNDVPCFVRVTREHLSRMAHIHERDVMLLRSAHASITISFDCYRQARDEMEQGAHSCDLMVANWMHARNGQVEVVCTDTVAEAARQADRTERDGGAYRQFRRDYEARRRAAMDDAILGALAMDRGPADSAPAAMTRPELTALPVTADALPVGRHVYEGGRFPVQVTVGPEAMNVHEPRGKNDE